jgi:hypothetical protein
MARRVKVDLVGDATSLNKAFHSATRSADKFGNATSRTRRVGAAAFKVLGTAGFLAAGAVVEGLKKSLEAADAHEKVMVQTMAAIKSTGGAAKVSAAHINQMSKAIQNQTGISRDDIQASENMLLAFTNVRNEVGAHNKIFDRASQIIQDYSVRTGKDAKNAAVIFGKALEDPEHKVTALSRAGIVFSQVLRDQIKTMVEHGNILGAQKLVLSELERRYGGAAKAAGGTFGGQLKILKLHLRDIEITIGNKLLPVLTKWSESINAWLSKAENQRKVMHAVRVATKAVAVAVKILTAAFRAGVAVTRVVIRVAQALTRVHNRMVRVNQRVANSFSSIWVSAKKHMQAFYNWVRRKGIEIALAIIEPFSHLPSFLGGKRFQQQKAELQKMLASIQGGSATSPGAPAGLSGPMTGAGAAARAAAPAGPRGPISGPTGHAVHHHHHHHIKVDLDGKQVAKTVTVHQRKGRARTAAQTRGRYGGHNHGE